MAVMAVVVAVGMFVIAGHRILWRPLTPFVVRCYVREQLFSIRRPFLKLCPMKAPSQVTSLWSEFKSFAFKGNMIDLAVAVVIGAAFGDVIKSIVNNLIMPLVSYVTPSKAYTTWHIGKLMYGQFLGDLLTFLIVSFAVFITIVKLLGAVMKRAGATPASSEPTTKECPFCLSVIPLKASKCSHCTADLPTVAAPSVN
jgi:large conductance mechanosensitive channel